MNSTERRRKPDNPEINKIYRRHRSASHSGLPRKEALKPAVTCAVIRAVSQRAD
jgi:hypothetical protein